MAGRAISSLWKLLSQESEKERQEAFQVAKKTFKGKGNPMEAQGNDVRSKNRWESFWEKEDDSGFTWQA